MTSSSVTFTALSGIPLVAPKDDLVALIADGLRREGLALRDGDIVVVAQKIVSKAEDRFVDLAGVMPSQAAQAIAARIRKDPRLVEVILSESEEIVRERGEVLIVAHRRGFVMANAGVDQSNVEESTGRERVLLLPVDPDASCATLKRGLDRAFGVDVGVIINDSFGRPWRNGVVGVALGAAGVPALRDLVGAPDLFRRPMRVTQVAVADELAAAASLLMGQAAEGRPVVHVRGFDSSGQRLPASALIRPKHQDLFR